MKKIIFTAIILIFVFAFSQYRSDVKEFDPRMNLMPSSSGTIFDMSRIKVDHSFSMNYSSTGTSSVFMNEYIAGINYRISDPMMLRFELGMSYVPYSTFSTPGEEQDAQVYLKSATFDYRPNKQFRLQIGFNNYDQSNLFFNSLDQPFGSNFLTPTIDE